MGGEAASRRKGIWGFGNRCADRRRIWGCVGCDQCGDRERPALDLVAPKQDRKYRSCQPDRPQGTVLACTLLPPGQHTTLIGPLRDSLTPGVSLPETAWMEVQNDAHGQGGGIVGFSSVSLRPSIVQA